MKKMDDAQRDAAIPLPLQVKRRHAGEWRNIGETAARRKKFVGAVPALPFFNVNYRQNRKRPGNKQSS